jgi:hypothetical protein
MNPTEAELPGPVARKGEAMKRITLVLSLLAFSQLALAETPFQFAAPNLRAPDDPNVNGIRFALFHGSNQRVRGVDLGFLSLSETADLSGFSAVLGMGKLGGDLHGCATGLINVHSGRDTGLNAAFVNRVDTVASGANLGFVNVTDGYTMVDLGGVNVSDRATVQVGFLNVARKLTGVQLGFLNLAENGFLPMFPFFNFPKN